METNSTQIHSPNYPQSLKALGKEAPQEIYYYGDLSLINPQNSISIVGTRKVSIAGKAACSSFVKNLKNQNITIVSGLACGIDSCAHQAALDNNLPTIAVIASGLEAFDYFGEQRLIFNELRKRDNCLILTEHPSKFPAIGWTFARRNRIIAALSHTTVVIEAPLKSGSLITADWALRLNHQVLALEGKHANYQGSNKLLEGGKAKPLILKNKQSQNPILNLLPSSFDLLEQELKIPANELSVQLSLLEIQGKVKKELGNYYLI